jgi:hypothetical protein
MQADSVTRILLSLILVCLVVLVARSFGGDRGLEAGWGRYSVTGMRAGSPILIRSDTVSGQVWKLELRGGGDRWIPFAEPDASASAREASPAPSATETSEVEIIEPPESLIDLELPPPPPRRSAPAAPPDDVVTLLEGLENAELPVDIRVWTAEQLAFVDDPRATAALIAALQDPERAVALAALGGLAGREDAKIRPALEALRSHPDPEIARSARSALE